MSWPRPARRISARWPGTRQPCTQSSRGFAESPQHVIFAGRLFLLLGQRVPGIAADGIDPDQIVISQLGNLAREKRFAARADVKLVGDIARNPVSRRAAHELERVFHFAIRHDIQKG